MASSIADCWRDRSDERSSKCHLRCSDAPGYSVRECGILALPRQVMLAEELVPHEIPLFHLGRGAAQGLLEPHYHASERVVVHGPTNRAGLAF